MFSKQKSHLGIKVSPRLIGATAQLAFVGSMALHQLNVPHTDFLQGLLLGYALVGNLFWLIKQRKKDETH